VRLSPEERERVFAAVADERRAIATLIDGLDAGQLSTPSLCDGWDVKTVAAHLVSDFADGFWGFLWSGVRHGDMDRGIDALARRRAQAPTAEITETLRCRADHRLSPPMTGPLSGLTDVLVHGADIRIPLGLPYAPDAQLAGLALDFLTGPRPMGFGSRRRLNGISLRDRETGRTCGEGVEVSGTVPALLIAATGRTALLDDLDGPGLPLLRERLRRV
jgi:uncharacterized protein (TIGR03083 family)